MLGKSPFCRDLKRNIPKLGKGALEYKASNAQRKTILRHHVKDIKDKQLHLHMTHGHRRRKRGQRRKSRGIIQIRVSIEKRPAIVNGRKTLGDIEIDLMMGKNYKGH